jgi:formate-dependent phosphoribosylglycinamide formyltransferase (GAR transformylase)
VDVLVDERHRRFLVLGVGLEGSLPSEDSAVVIAEQRRMGVALATAATVEEARERAKRCAASVRPVPA